MADDLTCHYAGHFPELESTELAMPRAAPFNPNALAPNEGLNPGAIGRPPEDLTGLTFGLLRITEKHSRSKLGTVWRALCTGCNREGTFSAHSLLKGSRKTCGDWNCRRKLRTQQIDTIATAFPDAKP